MKQTDIYTEALICLKSILHADHPEFKNWLDWLGRDMLARTVTGLSISIIIGVCAAAVSAAQAAKRSTDQNVDVFIKCHVDAGCICRCIAFSNCFQIHSDLRLVHVDCCQGTHDVTDVNEDILLEEDRSYDRNFSQERNRQLCKKRGDVRWHAGTKKRFPYKLCEACSKYGKCQTADDLVCTKADSQKSKDQRTACPR